MKNCIVYVQLLVSFFLFWCGFLEKLKTLKPSWRNYLIWIADWGGEQNTPDTQNTLISSFSAIAVCMWFFELKIISALFLIVRIHSTANWKTYIRANNYFQLPNKCSLFIWGIRTITKKINILSIILSLACVPFSLASIYKYWISVNKNTSTLKQIEQMRKCFL